MEEIKIRTELIKLDQFLKFAGICETGGQSKERIAGGEVTVNGEICLQRGKKLRPKDQVAVGGREFLIVGEENVGVGTEIEAE